MTADRTPTSEGPRTEVCRGCGLPWWLHGSPDRAYRIRTDTHSGHWFNEDRAEHQRLSVIEAEAAASPEERGGGADNRVVGAADTLAAVRTVVQRHRHHRANISEVEVLTEIIAALDNPADGERETIGGGQTPSAPAMTRQPEHSSATPPEGQSEPAPLDVEQVAEAMTHVRGAHNSEDQYGEGPPCDWCRLAAEQAIEAIARLQSTPTPTEEPT